jgi:hypothetical protein
MGDMGEIVCTFCGTIMELSREIAASADAHALHFFACDTCGASELRIHRSDTVGDSTEGDRTDRPLRTD